MIFKLSSFKVSKGTGCP